MTNSKEVSQNTFFWGSLISEKNVEIPEVPKNYGGEKGKLLKRLAIEQAQNYVCSENGVFEENWITAKTIDGAVFAYPDVDNLFDVSNKMNHGHAKGIDGMTLGMMMSLMAYSVGSFEYESQPELSKCLSNNYHSLNESFYELVDIALYPDEVEGTDVEKLAERLEMFADATSEQTAYLDRVSSDMYAITD